MSKNTDDIRIFLKYKEYYVDELTSIGDSFFDSVEILEKRHGKNWTSYLMPAGFLASRCAECYLKAMILSYQLDGETYKSVRKCKHNLTELLKLLQKYNKEAKNLTGAIETLDKYSNDKVAYPEEMFRDDENETQKLYGNDFIIITEIKNFINKLLT